MTIETKHSNIGESFRNYALVRTFLNEGEKERKERGDKEIRSNVYGGRKKKKKKPKTKTKTYGCNENIEKRNNIKNKKF